jgi:hypothetical protein
VAREDVAYGQGAGTLGLMAEIGRAVWLCPAFPNLACPPAAQFQTIVLGA